MKRFNAILLSLIVCISQWNVKLLDVNAAEQGYFNNGYLQFHSPSTTYAVNDKGTLNQPFYHATGSTWYALTYSTNPLNYSIGVGQVSDSVSPWNLEGLILTDRTLDNYTFDESNNTISDSLGYGTIKLSGTLNYGDYGILNVENNFELPQDKNFVKITTTLTNNNLITMKNIRYWVGTRDDWIGTTDVNRKEKGNIVNGEFVTNTSSSETASALRITSGSEGVLFYTTNTNTNMAINSYGDFYSRIVSTNPNNVSVDITNDGSYGLFVPLGDLEPGASVTITWYYAAGAASNLGSIISDVASAASSFTNIDYHSANFTVTTNITSTGYYIVVPDGSTVPTAEQIIAGTNYTGGTVVLHGSDSLTANVAKTFSLSGLTQGGTYKVYFVTQYTDSNSQIQNSNISVGTLTLVSYGPPIVSATGTSTNIVKTTATFNGEVTSNNSENTKPITERGFVYSTSANPTTSSGTKVINDFGETNGLSTFSSDITGLSEHTTYYVRAYAINDLGTSYGTQTSFTTLGTVTTSLSGVTIPVTGSTMTTSISGTSYDATISWSPSSSDGKFHAGISYVATLTITPKSGYNLNDIAANSFTLSGASSISNSANSGVVTVHYPETQFNQVIYNSNGGNTISNVDVDYGDAIVAPTTPTKYGNAFDGWYTDNDTFENEFDFNNTIMGSSDITLYAKWIVGAYTMSFDTNGGSYVSPLAQNAGTAVTSPVSPSRPGYIFAGWSSNANLSNVYEFTVMPGENTTLYAKWNKIVYSINYDLGGGSSSNPNTYTIEDGFSLSDPTRLDYTFTGWTINGESRNWVAKGTTGDLSVVAHWVRTLKDPILGSLNLSSLNSEGAQFNLSILDLGYPAISSYQAEITNIDTGEVSLIKVSSPINIDLSGLQAYTNYSIRIIVSNGTKTLASNSVSFKPQLKDSDHDGVPDVRDAYPSDSSKSMDVTQIQPDATPKRTYIGTLQENNAEQYGIQITQKDIMGLEASDNILVVMGSVQFVIPVAMVDTIISNTHEDGAYLTLKVQPQIIETQDAINAQLLNQENMKIVAAYDYLLFQVWSNGREEPIHELGGQIKVGIGLNQLVGEYDPNNMEVYFYNTEDGTIQTMRAVYDPVTQSMVFLTEHFSYYVLGVKKEDDPASVTMKVLFLGIAIGIALVSLFLWLLKRKSNK